MGDSPNDHNVSFVGRQVLLEQSQLTEQPQGAPESSLLARVRSHTSDMIFTGTIDYSFKSNEGMLLLSSSFVPPLL
jgi:hypothetical protein